MGILLWRVWRNVAPHFESWLFERRCNGRAGRHCGLARDSSLGVYVRHRRPRSRGHVVCPHRPRRRRAGNAPFPLAHGFAGSREAKVSPPCAPALSRRMLVTEKLIISLCAAPLGRHFLCGVPVSTIFVKLLVRFWSVGVRVEGQKIAGEKSSEKVLVGELLRFSTAFEQKKLCGYCRRLRCRGHGGAGCWS